MAKRKFVLANSKMCDAGRGGYGPETELSLSDLSISEEEEDNLCVRDEDLSSWTEVKHDAADGAVVSIFPPHPSLVVPFTLSSVDALQ